MNRESVKDPVPGTFQGLASITLVHVCNTSDTSSTVFHLFKQLDTECVGNATSPHGAYTLVLGPETKKKHTHTH